MECLKGTRTLRQRRGRSVSYLRRWAREEGQREAESKQTNKQTTRQPCRAPCATAALEGEPSQAEASERRGRDAEDMPGAGGSAQSPGSSAGARQAPFPWGGAAEGKGGSTPNFLPPSRDEVKKAPGAGGLRVPCRLDKPRRWIWQPGQGQRGPALSTGQIREGNRDRLPVGAARPAPASCGHLLRAGSSLCLVVGSICGCTESRGEGGEQREKAQLVDEQREACRKPSPQNTRNR